jgi:ubiquinone/menaquinone biosynthesis C-methylase UbiE
VTRRGILSHDEARRFYDWFGRKQDAQAFYETPALRELTAHLTLEKCHAVVEFGCGTGRFAEELLDRRLPPGAHYVGFDVSRTMTRLASARLARFGPRAEIRETDGSPRLDLPDRAVDRFICCYVLDLLAENDIGAVLAEAHRVLIPGGMAGLVGLTQGRTPLSGLVSTLWDAVHRLSPSLVGGCRPLELRAFLAPALWTVTYAHVVAPYGIPSEVVIVESRP